MNILPYDDYTSTAAKLLAKFKTAKKAGDAIAKAKWQVTLDGETFKISMAKKLIHHLHNPEANKAKPISL